MKTVLTSLILLYTCLISAENLIEQPREENQIYRDSKTTIPSSTPWLERVNKYVTALQHLCEDYIQQEIAYWKDFYNKQTK